MKTCCKKTYIAVLAEVVITIKQNNIQTVNEIVNTLEYAIKELEQWVALQNS